MESTIPFKVEACLQSFAILVELVKNAEPGLFIEGQDTTQIVLECKQKFVEWARITGAHQQQRKSALEQRLLGSSELQQSVVELLGSLHNSLSQGNVTPVILSILDSVSYK